MRPVRNSAKAVIIRDGRLLVVVNRGPNGVFYVLPGGGQEPGETLPEAVRRECLEEVGVRVEVGELLLVRDYIARNHEFAAESPDVHALELMFACRLSEGAEPGRGELLDEWQEGVTWLPLETLESEPLYPRAIRPFLAARDFNRVYLGDVN